MHCLRVSGIVLVLSAMGSYALECYICGSHMDITCAGRFQQGDYKGERTTIDPTTFMPCQICTKNEYMHNGNTHISRGCSSTWKPENCDSHGCACDTDICNAAVPMTTVSLTTVILATVMSVFVVKAFKCC
ncbi:hypothetical protein MAR_008819 [Mya arenaria]|uniref:Protein quiver n=1 Tax=Mya arenaria TaxID=6604 RepID=A0ABY7E536_MYAAR|nr:uncharacterized protein LOC128229791 [Mya arenaria]WAR02261.1 hypothetical protein MAR_008819 [Mya arenaria]